MNRSALAIGGLVALLASAASGCISSTRAVRRRAASDLGCPESRIAVVELGAGGHRAIGCGRQQDYTCVEIRSESRVYCAPDTTVVVTPPPAAPATPAASGWTEREVTAALEAFRDPMMSCVAAPSIVLGIDLSPEGTVVNVQFSGLSEGARDCIRRTLATLDIPGAVALAGHVNFTVTRSVAAGPTGTLPTSPGDPETERRVRALVDARGARILACAGTSSTAIIVEWDADGALRASVRGGDAAVNGCVAAALADATLAPAPGRAGSVLHSVAE